MQQHPRSRVTIAGILACAVVGGLIQPLFASELALYSEDTDKPKVNATWTPEKAMVAVDNGYFFTLQSNAAGYTIAQRFTIVHERLIEVLSRGPLAPITIGKIRGKNTIWVGNIRLVTLYPEDAAAANMSEDALAAAVAAQTALALQKVAPTRFVTGPSTADIAVGGVLLFHLTDADGYDIMRQRARIIDRRIVDLLSEGRISPISTQAMGADTEVLVNGKLLLTVTAGDARYNGFDSSEDLASALIDRLQKVWPKVRPSPH